MNNEAKPLRPAQMYVLHERGSRALIVIAHQLCAKLAGGTLWAAYWLPFDLRVGHRSLHRELGFLPPIVFLILPYVEYYLG
jgi:hypothetical protein